MLAPSAATQIEMSTMKMIRYCHRRLEVPMNDRVDSEKFRPSRTKETQLNKITQVIKRLKAALFLMTSGTRMRDVTRFLAPASGCVGMKASKRGCEGGSK
jgi:hypothetical protein